MTAVTLPLPSAHSPLVARLVLAGLAALLVAGALIDAPKRSGIPKEQGDVGLFTTVVDGVAKGERYYETFGPELRRRGYPTASVFNWRMPLVLSAVAKYPRAARVLFTALGVLALVITVAVLLKQPPEVLAASVLAQIAVVIPLVKVPEYIVMSEAWCGLLILASVGAYAKKAWVPAAALAVAALLTRELAAPYCVACGLIAIARRRRAETAVWVVGAALMAGYFAWHVAQVQAQMTPQDLPHKASWWQLPGLAFVLRTIAFTGWFDVLPPWTRAVGCALLIASLWAKPAIPQLRAAVGGYLLFFALVGLPFNQYWGLVSGPVWALAYGLGIAGLWRLITAARGAPQVSAHPS